MTIRAAIVGASGYTGGELVRLLVQHPHVHVERLCGHSAAGKRIEDIHTSLRSIVSMSIDEFDSSSLKNIDVMFVALPSGQAMNIVPAILKQGSRVIDLGGDFRLDSALTYKTYYGHEHTAANLLGKSVYGLTEWNCQSIKSANLLTNPGCYPTSIQLPLIPLVKEDLIAASPIAITSYSGTSGAGKSLSEKMLFTEVNESVKAYKVGTHQHNPEIKQYLEMFTGKNVSFTFVPHLLPVTRGIYTTIHATLRSGVSAQQIATAYEAAYASSPFVRLVAPAIPEMKDVLYSNFCDIGYVVDGDNLVVFSTIDNLGKGAAGQAIQNMNTMFALPQTEGLLPCFKKN